MSEVPPFVHLHVRSHYSLLTAPEKVGPLVAAAQADGQTAMALTDNGNMFGAVDLFKECKKVGIKPIIGQTTYYAGRTNKETAGADNPTFDLTLLAATNEGLENLKKMSGKAYLEGFSYRPRVDYKLIEQHKDGIICLSGTLTSQIAMSIQQNDWEGAKSAALRMRDLFGPENFYLEVAHTGNDAQRKVTLGMRKLGEELGIPCVATNDVYYLKQEDWLAQDIMFCIRSGKSVADQSRFRMGSKELYLKSREEMARAFKSWPEALENTVKIADRCNIDIEFGVYHVPVYEAEDGSSPDDFFAKLCHDGAIERYGEISKEVRERLDYEVGIIKKLGFVSYFLITWDFIAKAREMGIPVGPGRGSAAGSIVSYCLRITDVCPLQYGLLFERFLNPGRVSMPDIDIDFCGIRRGEVIEYVRKKYGEDCVCQIITFGTMASRGVMRDVGRVLDFPVADIDKLCKKVPSGPGASLVAALETDTELQEVRDSSPQYKRLFELAVKLEGSARHSSIHAAGVVISDKPLEEYVPLAKSGEDIVTQWQMTELEEVGLLKMDFLGLKTLTILQEGARLVKEVHGIDIDLDHLPLDDKPTYDLMTRGETQGVFQLESSGMRELLTRLKPDNFEDVIAVLALYRPGPLGSGMVDMYVRRKHGEEKTILPHEDTRKILEPTYGVIVYQEQVMQISGLIGGFSMSEADNLRKAMGKKKPEVMLKFKDMFIEGAEAQKYSGKFAKELFETMEYFAGYGFNKSHSTAYALVTYQTAWLKAHYPTEFIAANLTTESGNSEKIKEFVDDIRRADMKILGPSVNHSMRYFGVEDGAIRYGLGAIKGVGTRVADGIAENRAAHGPYANLDDLCERLESAALNKTALESLVQSGAFDDMGRTRAGNAAHIEQAIRAAASAREDRRRGQAMLFAPPPIETALDEENGVPEWPEHDRLTREKESLGFYLSGHPFEKRGGFLKRIAGNTTATVGQLQPSESVRIAGMISGVRILQIKQGKNAGKKMAKFLLEDLEGMVPVTCFARAYETLKEHIVEDEIVFLTGRQDKGSEEPALLLDALDPAAVVVRREVSGIVLHLDASMSTEVFLGRVAAIAELHKGNHQLNLDVEDGEDYFRIRADGGVAISDELIDSFAVLVGPDNMSFTRM